MQRRTILSALLGSALVTRHALTGTAWAQEAAWPTRPIKMVVPFAAGGASDVGARLIAGEISRALDQPVYIENIGGAGGTVGGGSTVTKDTPAGALTVARGKQISIPNWQRPSKKK